MTTCLSDGLELEVERGPNWLLVKIRPGDSLADPSQLAEDLWSIATRHFIYRLVLDFNELETLPEGLIGQFVTLQERLNQCDGALRLCGLSAECEAALQRCEVESALSNHATREEAIMGSSDLSVVAR